MKIGGMVILLLLLVLFGIYLKTSSDVMGGNEMSTPVADLLPDKSSLVEERNFGNPNWLNLPPRLAQMQSMARNGDAVAHCAIAVELQRCKNFADNDYTHELVGANKNLSGTQEQCADVPVLGASEIISYWRSAAESGSAFAKKYYVLGKPFKINHTIDSLEELGIYKNSAERYALDAASRGDVSALFALADAYYPFKESGRRVSLLDQAIASKDPVKSLAIYESLSKYYADSQLPSSGLIQARMARLKDSMSIADISRSKVLFSSWPSPVKDTTELLGDSLMLCEK